jgi:hypothetical protein
LAHQRRYVHIDDEASDESVLELEQRAAGEGDRIAGSRQAGVLALVGSAETPSDSNGRVVSDGEKRLN